MDTTTEFSGNVPRTIRNRVVHETPQHLQHDEEEEEEREGSKMTKSERKELQARVGGPCCVGPAVWALGALLAAGC